MTEKRIDILTREPGKPLVADNIKSTLDEFKLLVDGRFDVIEKSGYLICYDELGRLYGKPLNAVVDGQQIYGRLFVARSAKYGDFGNIHPSDLSNPEKIYNLFEELF